MFILHLIFLFCESVAAKIMVLLPPGTAEGAKIMSNIISPKVRIHIGICFEEMMKEFT